MVYATCGVASHGSEGHSLSTDTEARGESNNSGFAQKSVSISYKSSRLNTERFKRYPYLTKITDNFFLIEFDTEIVLVKVFLF